MSVRRMSMSLRPHPSRPPLCQPNPSPSLSQRRHAHHSRRSHPQWRSGPSVNSRRLVVVAIQKGGSNVNPQWNVLRLPQMSKQCLMRPRMAFATDVGNWAILLGTVHCLRHASCVGPPGHIMANCPNGPDAQRGRPQSRDTWQPWGKGRGKGDGKGGGEGRGKGAPRRSQSAGPSQPRATGIQAVQSSPATTVEAVQPAQRAQAPLFSAPMSQWGIGPQWVPVGPSMPMSPAPWWNYGDNTWRTQSSAPVNTAESATLTGNSAPVASRA